MAICARVCCLKLFAVSMVITFCHICLRGSSSPWSNYLQPPFLHYPLRNIWDNVMPTDLKIQDTAIVGVKERASIGSSALPISVVYATTGSVHDRRIPPLRLGYSGGAQVGCVDQSWCWLESVDILQPIRLDRWSEASIVNNSRLYPTKFPRATFKVNIVRGCLIENKAEI